MSANEVLEVLLASMPDSYQKTIGFPTYDLLAAASLRLAETDAVIEDARAALDPENLTGGELDRYIYPRSGIARKAATFAGGVLTVRARARSSRTRCSRARAACSSRRRRPSPSTARARCR